MSAPLRSVDEFRSAARRILRDDRFDGRVRIVSLMRLVRRAKGSDLSEFAVGAIVAELLWSIDGPWVRAGTFGDPLEKTHRRLRYMGYERCPECLSPLLTEVDEFYAAQRRDAASVEADYREAAVG